MAREFGQQNPDGSVSVIRQNDDGSYEVVRNESWEQNQGIAPSGSGGGGGISAEHRAGLRQAGYPDWANPNLTEADWQRISQGAQQAAQQAGYSSGLAALLQAQSATRQQEFDWQKEQYGKSLAEQQREYDITAEANRRQQYSQLAQGLLGGAAALRGPANWLDYANYTQGGQNIFKRLFGSQAAPTFGAPSASSQPAGIEGVLADLGILPGKYSQTQGQATTQPYAPLPYQINPGVLDAMSNTAKQMILGAVEKGYTPSGAWTSEDYLNQLNAARPQGVAPRRTTYQFGAPQGYF